MPTIPHYNLDVDDLTAMDYLTFAKKRMIRDIKTDRSLENADKYINDISFKDTGDASSTINNIKEIFNLWNKSYNLLVDIGNKIIKPVDVNGAIDAITGASNGNTRLIRDETNISTDIIEKTNIINNNLIEMLDKLYSIIKNPSTINKIPKEDIDKLYNFFKKWILKFLGNNPRLWTGVASSQVLRFNINLATERYIRNDGRDRLKRNVGKPMGFVDVETICNNFGEMLENWYNFRDAWRIFIKVYNTEPA